jgi:hypothetical protein
MKRVLAAYGVALGAVASVSLVAVPASAGNVKTHVLVTMNGQPVTGPVTVDANAAAPVVTVSLDDGCLSAFNNKAFGYTTSTDNPSAVTVDPTFRSGLYCPGTTTFSLIGHANGSATIRFDVDAPNGLQGQAPGASITATAINYSTNGGGNPPGHERPAAPAVTNGFLNTQSQKDACMAAYDGAKNWHGQLIRAVAKWAAANHLGKAKDDVQQYPTDNDWIAHVQAEVNTLCT